MKTVKPAKCESLMLRQPVAPCEILPAGIPGSMSINGVAYRVEILGYLPEVGEPVIDGYRLTKDNGEAHDLCLVAGRLECTCGDYEFRRAAQQDRELCDCKHCLAVKTRLVEPRDQYVPSAFGVDDCVFDDPC